MLGVTAASVVLGVALAWLVDAHRSARPPRVGRRRRPAARHTELRRGPGPARRLRPTRPAPSRRSASSELPDIRGYWGALLALTLATYPYVYLLCASALRSQDPALEDAARGLGHSPWRSFFTVTVPMLRPTMGVGAVLVALYVLSDFGVVSLMNYDALDAGDLPPVQGVVRPDACGRAGPAAGRAHGTRAPDRGVDAPRGRATTAPHPARPGQLKTVPLGAWRYPALAFCGADRRAVPRSAGRCARLLARPGDRERARTRLPVGARHVDSLTASALAAGVAAAAAIAHCGARRALSLPADAAARAAGLLRKRACRGSSSRSRSSSSPPATRRPLYQTLALLVFAYVVRFFPQALSGRELRSRDA